MDPKRIVADGYDKIAETFLAWGERVDGDAVRSRYLAALTDGLPDGARVLELGCGAGIPVARLLAERFEVTGVDISARQIELARQHVPNATFVHGDMAALTFPEASFDDVGAFYALVHLPREQHAALFESIASWLKPGGTFVATLTGHSHPGLVEEWLGVPMYFSGHPSDVSQQLVEAAGLEIISAQEETIDEDGTPVAFFWIVARKPIS
jgi:SAM-dependent methyltransferase